MHAMFRAVRPGHRARCLAWLGLIGLQATVVAQPSVESFLRPPAFTAPALSPDGRHVVAVINPEGRTQALAIIETDQPGQMQPLQAFAEVDISHVQWLNDHRLVFTARPRAEPYSRGANPGLWAINADGSDLRQWVNPIGRGGAPARPQASRMLDAMWTLWSLPRDGSDDVILAHYVFAHSGTLRAIELARLNTVTGERRMLTDGAPDGLRHWVLDAANQPLFGIGLQDDGRLRVEQRQADGSWQRWLTAAEPDQPAPRQPQWVDADGRLYLLRPSGGPAARWALHRSDSLKPDAATTQLLAAQAHDVWPEPVFDDGGRRLVGVRYEAETARTLWLEAGLASAQAEVDRLLPGSVNRLDCSRCTGVPTLLVTAQSDRRPPRYFLFDRNAKRLTPLAGSQPWLGAGAERIDVRVAARDGLALPLLITRPADAKAALPTVLLIHGGPWARGNYWPWETEAQFLASRGYLVLQVDFRGSTGYGARHERAGDKQWGRAMQDDLDDALDWAVAQGLADPRRVCLVGDSYGGYAALMGLARSRDSGRIACAVAGFAPTDLTRLSSRHWSDVSMEALNFSFPRRVGDPEREAELLVAQSPLSQVAQMKAPLMLVYGEQDPRVLPAHGTALRDALTADGRAPEWLLYPGAGHGLWRADQRLDYYQRLEAFLAKHLAAPN